MEGAWALPSIEELLTLVDYGFNPATELPGMLPSDYWSSSPCDDYSEAVWHINPHYYVRHAVKTNWYYVRAVREGNVKGKECKHCKHWEQYNAAWGSCEKLPDEIRNPATIRFDSCSVRGDFFCGCYDYAENRR